MIFKRKAFRQAQGDKMSDKVAGVIAGGILHFQRKVSERLNKMKGLKIVLIGFCFISGSVSIYFLVDALFSKPAAAINIEKIMIPAGQLPESPVPDDMYRNIQDYKKYMDSLGESIRPGLLDSIKFLEDIYLQQK